MKKYLILAVLIATLLFLPQSSKAVELITNGNFENATAFLGWTQSHSGCTDNGSAYFPPTVASSYAPGSSGAGITAFAGTRSAFNPWTCGPLLVAAYYPTPGGYTLSQDVTVPAGNSITLRFADSLYTNLAFYPAGDYRSARAKQFRVEIRNTSNVVLVTPFSLTAPANTLTNTGWTSRAFNLGAAYAGQTIRLAFVWTTNTGLDAPGKVGLDNVSIDASIPTAASVSVSGRALNASGRGISRVTITATDSGGNTRFAMTNPFGYFRFSDLQAGQVYVFQAISKRYEFTNPTQVLSISDDTNDVNFTASR